MGDYRKIHYSFYRLLPFVICLLSVELSEEHVSVYDYRLSRSIVPQLYKLSVTLQPNFYRTRQFCGFVQIMIKMGNETSAGDKITLNTKNVEIIYVTLQYSNSTKIAIKDIVTDSTLERICITLSEPVEHEGLFLLSIDYTGTIQDDISGLYADYYYYESHKQWFAATYLKPTGARKLYPCFDEPHFKAVFEISVTHPKHYTAISNSQILEQKPDKDDLNLMVTTFRPSPRMPPQLVAIVVSKLQSKTNTLANGMEHRVWLQKGLEEAELVTCRETTAYVLKSLRKITGIPYNVSGLGKLEQVALPGFTPGGMENWGIPIYKEVNLLWNKSHSSSLHKQRVAQAIAHELSHVWFGNLRTMDWWNVLWLNEGFATFFTHYVVDKMNYDLEIMSQFVVAQQQTVMDADSDLLASPLTSPERSILTPWQIKGKFSDISYAKGASILRMMLGFMGEKTFLEGIQQYMLKGKKRNYDTVTPQSLWDAWPNGQLSRNLPEGKRLRSVMEGWTEKQGFPVVHVRSEHGKVIFTAERFLFNNTKKHESVWYIPLTYATAKKPDFDSAKPYKTWICGNKPLEVEEDLDDGWIVVNIQASAYIRVNYDEKLWNKLVQALLTNHKEIHILNRAQIVNDAFSLARAGLISYLQCMYILKYLQRELGYFPWYSAFKGFDFLLRRFPDDIQISSKLNELIHALTLELNEDARRKKHTTNHVDIIRNEMAMKWACRDQNSDCAKEAAKLLNGFIVENVPVEPALRSYVYCTGIRHTSHSNWHDLYLLITESKVASEQDLVIDALGCTLDGKLLELYLNRSIDLLSKLSKDQAASIFKAVVNGSSKGMHVGLNFLIQNFREMVKRYDAGVFGQAIGILADKFASNSEIKKFDEFIMNKDLGTYTSLAKTALASSKESVAWAQKRRNSLSHALDTRFTLRSCAVSSTVFSKNVCIVVHILYHLCICWLIKTSN